MGGGVNVGFGPYDREERELLQFADAYPIAFQGREGHDVYALLVLRENSDKVHHPLPDVSAWKPQAPLNPPPVTPLSPDHPPGAHQVNVNRDEARQRVVWEVLLSVLVEPGEAEDPADQFLEEPARAVLSALSQQAR